MRLNKAQKDAVRAMYAVTDATMAKMAEEYKRVDNDNRRFRLFWNRLNNVYFLCWQDTFDGYEYGISQWDAINLAEGRQVRKWTIKEAIPYNFAKNHIGTDNEIK